MPTNMFEIGLEWSLSCKNNIASSETLNLSNFKPHWKLLLIKKICWLGNQTIFESNVKFKFFAAFLFFAKEFVKQITQCFKWNFFLNYSKYFFLTYLAFCGPTDFKSNADDAVISSSLIWPCSMPRAAKQDSKSWIKKALLNRFYFYHYYFVPKMTNHNKTSFFHIVMHHLRANPEANKHWYFVSPSKRRFPFHIQRKKEGLCEWIKWRKQTNSTCKEIFKVSINFQSDHIRILIHHFLHQTCNMMMMNQSNRGTQLSTVNYKKKTWHFFYVKKVHFPFFNLTFILKFRFKRWWISMMMTLICVCYYEAIVK